MRQKHVPYRIVFFLYSILLVVLTTHPVMAVIKIQTDGIVRGHAISGSDTVGDINNDPGIGEPLANLRVNGSYDWHLKAYGELYLGKTSSAGESVNIGSFYGSTGTYFSPYEIKFGKFEVPFGLQRTYRSDHAEVQKHSLIGNPLVDPTDHQLGGQMIGERENVRWTVSITNGSDGTQLNPDRGYGASAKLDYQPAKWIYGSVSIYRSQHSDSSSQRGVDSPTVGNIFGPDDLDSASSLSNLQTGLTSPYPKLDYGLGTQPDVLTAGRDLMAWQLDLEIKPGKRVFLRIHHGKIEDNLSNLGWNFSGNREEQIRWDYTSLEGIYSIAPSSYVAARLNQLNAKSLRDVPRLGSNVSRNGSMDRYQIGIGHQFSNNLLFKIEYVSSEENITADDFEYDGISFEASLTGFPKIGDKNLSYSSKNS